MVIWKVKFILASPSGSWQRSEPECSSLPSCGQVWHLPPPPPPPLSSPAQWTAASRERERALLKNVAGFWNKCPFIYTQTKLSLMLSNSLSLFPVEVYNYIVWKHSFPFAYIIPRHQHNERFSNPLNPQRRHPPWWLVPCSCPPSLQEGPPRDLRWPLDVCWPNSGVKVK